MDTEITENCSITGAGDTLAPTTVAMDNCKLDSVNDIANATVPDPCPAADLDHAVPMATHTEIEGEVLVAESQAKAKTNGHSHSDSSGQRQVEELELEDIKMHKGHGQSSSGSGSAFSGSFDMDKLAQVVSNIPGHLNKKSTPKGPKGALSSTGATASGAGGGDTSGGSNYMPTVGADVAHMIRSAEEAGLIPPEARFYSSLRVRPVGSSPGESSSEARKLFPLRGFSSESSELGGTGTTTASARSTRENQLEFLKKLSTGTKAATARPKTAGYSPGANKSPKPSTGLRLSAGATGAAKKSPEQILYPHQLPSTSRLLRPTTSVSAKYSVSSGSLGGASGSGSDVDIGIGTATPSPLAQSQRKSQTPTKAKTSREEKPRLGFGTGTGTPSPKNLNLNIIIGTQTQTPTGRRSFGRMGDSGAGDAPSGTGAGISPGPGIPTLKEQFGAFSRFGDATSDGKQITLSNCDKWMKQAHVIDGKKITTTDTSIAFKKLFKTAKKVGFEDFKRYVDDLASSKKLEAKDILEKLTKCGAPGLSTATKAAHVGVVERLTDTSKYTGSHKERFDASGKGKGLEGRRDVGDNSGYVGAFKDKLDGSPAAK